MKKVVVLWTSGHTEAFYSTEGWSAEKIYSTLVRAMSSGRVVSVGQCELINGKFIARLTLVDEEKHD